MKKRQGDKGGGEPLSAVPAASDQPYHVAPNPSNQTRLYDEHQYFGAVQLSPPPSDPISEKSMTPETQTRGIAMTKLLTRLVTDERGGEVLEYALIVGLIVVAAIAAITSVGTKVLARWSSLDSSV
jgi:Flp pilus assembly pilin Flp